MSTQQQATTFYMHKAGSSPIALLYKELPRLATAWSGNPSVLDGIHDPGMNKEILRLFCDIGYRKISITAGLPHGDYGQTITLYHKGEFQEPNIESLTERGLIPDHLISNSLPMSPDHMTKMYQHIQTRDTRVEDMSIVKEQWFFEFQLDYFPKTFVDLVNSLGALRYLSEIVHDLQHFSVVLMNNGVYVELSATESPSYKPPFRIRS